MSVEKRRLKNAKYVWRVRWREAGRNRARNFDRRRDAEIFDVEVKRRRRFGTLDVLDTGQETLAEFAREWFVRYARPNLQRATQEGYARLWDTHVLPRLGAVELRRLTPHMIESFRADLERAGVGPAAVRKSLIVLQGILRYAVLHGQIPANPVAPVKKPPQRRQRAVHALAPSSVEAIRETLLRRGDVTDATLISLLAYAGLRPQEALALRWRDVGERRLIVERAIAFGEVKETKTRRSRSVRLLGPLAADLAQHRLRQGRPGDDALVFPSRGGPEWQDHDYRNWRMRTFARAILEAGLPTMRPYDLRHSFASLLFAEGSSVIEVAAQMGNSPSVALDTYGHVIAELAGAERGSAEATIRAAREHDVPLSYPREATA